MNDITTLHSYRCDLDAGPCEVELHKLLMYQDALADTFCVAVCRGMQHVDLAGMTVCGYLYFAATRQTLPLTGTASGNSATVTLTEDCYALPGWASLAIQLQSGAVRHTVLKVDLVIQRTGSAILFPSGSAPTLAELLARIAALEASAGSGEVIPAYWLTHLDSRAASIREAMAVAGWNKSTFLWYTDVHWTYGYKQSPMLLKYLYQHTPINKTIFGGDIVDAEGDDTITMAYLWDWRAAIRDLPNHHSVPGNHDDGNSTDNRWEDAYIYNYLLAAEETPDVVRGSALYYHIDVPTEKTRYLYLDTATKDGNILNDATQQSWLKETLLSTPDGWHIVAIGHIWRVYTSTDGVYTDNGWGMGAKIALDMFDAYNARTDDYASCTGKVEFCVGGHTHWDVDHTSDGGIPVILTECDSRYVRSGLSCTEGTTTEASVNAIVADYTTGVVNVIRIGRGSSRVVQLDGSGSTEVPDSGDTGDEEETSDYDLVAPTGDFTNALKAAINADGTSYNNGYGYLNDTRVKSDQTDTAAEGWDSTGYIAAACGDVIRFLNLEFTDTQDTGGDTKRTAFHCFDSEFNFIAVSPTFEYGVAPGDVWAAAYGDDGDIVQLTLPTTSYYANTAYVRIVAKNITGASVITVNEEINV